MLNETYYVLMFDAKMVSISNKRKYRKFIKEIKSIGYYMIQKSVYVRYSKTLSSLDSEDDKIKKVTPDTISIRIIALSKLLFKSIKNINCEEVLIHEENDIICI